MSIRQSLCATVWLIAVGCSTAQARLAQPDYVLYGTATWFGEPVADGTVVSLRLESQGVIAAEYQMGSDPQLDTLYALRVPMDAIDPRRFGYARPGDPATILINDNRVADVIIGHYGVAERLDIDPANLLIDTVALSISPASIPEGNSGTSQLVLTVLLSDVAADPVTVEWATADGTATGGTSCTLDIDYLSESGLLSIPTGESSGEVSIDICGDAQIEPSELLEVVLSNPANAIIQFGRADGTILDDDGQPELRVADQVVFEPQSGELVQSFEISLSRAYDQEIEFDYATSNGTALAGLDYVATTGHVVIPAGEDRVQVAVHYLADSETESPETVLFSVTGVVNAIPIRPLATAIILDAQSDPQTEPQGGLSNDDESRLLTPSHVVIGPDDRNIYVPVLVNGGIVHLTLHQGALSAHRVVDALTTGFESGIFGGLRHLSKSPDSRFLFAAASGDNGIMAMSRTNGGNLQFASVHTESADNAYGLRGAWGSSVSPDGLHLYVAGSEDDAISVWSIDANGALTWIEAERDAVDDPSDAGGAVVFMDRPLRLTVSADGNYLFAAVDFDSSVVIFERDSSSGRLTFHSALKNDVSGVQGIGGAADLALSPDGKHLYVLGRAENSISRFDLGGSEPLVYVQTWRQTNADFVGLDAPTALAFSTSGDHLYVVGIDDSSLVTFLRSADPADTDYGNLHFADLRVDNTPGVEQLAGPTGLAVTANGRWTLVAAGVDNAVSVFRNPYAFPLFEDSFETP